MDNKKYKLMLFGAVVVCFLLITYGTYRTNYETHLIEARDYLAAESMASSNIISNKIKQLSNDIDLLADSPFLSDFIDQLQSDNASERPSSAAQVLDIFKHYVTAHEFVYQIRLISIGNDGKEIIRVELDGNDVIQIPDEKLQHKAHRDYFKDITKNISHEVYISPINLNREYGDVQEPLLPTIRFAAKVYDKYNNLFGFVIINYSIYDLFKSIEDSFKGKGELVILNEDGYLLFHEDFSKTFGFDLNNNLTWDSFVEKTNGYYFYKSTPNDKFIISENTTNIDKDESINLLLTKRLSDIETISLKNSYLSGLAFLFGLAVFLVYYFYQKHTLRHLAQINAERARLSSIVKFSQDAIISIDMNGVITDWNPSACKLYGYREHEAIGQRYEGLLMSFGETVQRIINQTQENEHEIPPYEAIHTTQSGEPIDVSVTPSPIYNENKSLSGYSVIIRNISDDKRNIKEISLLNSVLETQFVEQSLELSSIYRLNQTIIQNAGSAIISGDKQGQITMFNPAAELLLGYSAEEVVGRTTPAIFHVAKEVKNHTEYLCKKYNTTFEPGFKTFVFESDLGVKNEYEWTYVTKSGQAIPVLLSISALFDEDGEITGYLGIATDITEIHQSRKKLENVRDQLKQATEVATIGIWSWNMTANTYRWNEQMYDIYEVENGSEVSFERWLSWVDMGDRSKIQRNIERILNGAVKEEVTFKVYTPTGNTKIIQSRASLQNDSEGNALVIGINRDITEQVNYESRLKQAKIDSDNANRTKSEFVANMSHEIRTPMNGIIGLLQLLQHTELSSQQQEYVLKSESAAKALLHIINDILDFSKIEAGKLTVEAKPFDLNALLSNVRSIMQAIVANKSVELTFEIDDSMPRAISMDSIRLQQILINLVGNAVKFTEQGYVRVNISQAIENQQPVMRCEVSDTGLGIEASKQKLIFKAFEQAESSIVRSYGGTGLGLAISKHLIEMMGGHIEMHSKLNQGSTFTFTLPFTLATNSNLLEQAKPTQPDTTDQPEQANPLQDIKILLVEDNATNQLVANKLLTLKGANVTIANNGQEAVDLMSDLDNCFDVILMDIQMPVLDGYSAAKHITHKLKLATPIIAMTANALESDKIKAKEAGMIDHVSKPFNINGLVDTIKKHLA